MKRECCLFCTSQDTDCVFVLLICDGHGLKSVSNQEIILYRNAEEKMFFILVLSRKVISCKINRKDIHMYFNLYFLSPVCRSTSLNRVGDLLKNMLGDKETTAAISVDTTTITSVPPALQHAPTV